LSRDLATREFGLPTARDSEVRAASTTPLVTTNRRIGDHEINQLFS
jgi:hypothetical protein